MVTMSKPRLELIKITLIFIYCYILSCKALLLIIKNLILIILNKKRFDRRQKPTNNMLEKHYSNLQLVDDLIAGDPFLDKRFKDIVISIQSTFISASSNIMQKMLSKISLRTSLNWIMKFMTILYLVDSNPTLGDWEQTKARVNKIDSNIHLLSNT